MRERWWIIPVLLCSLVWPGQAEEAVLKWTPVGRVKIVDQRQGVPRLQLEMPALPEGEQVKALRLLRSTTDLNRFRSARRFPIARLPVGLGEEIYVDTRAPQDVRLYYQLETRTDKGELYWSNVVSTVLAAPSVSKMSGARILVDKSQYTLSLLEGDQVKRIFPIALGADCVRRKLHLDRASTPEGVYYISSLQPQATYYRAIDINYPNELDWRRYKAFAARGLLPKPTPPIGGEIQIHGEGIESNWTWGCMALRNSDMDWLFSRPELRQGMEVRIVGAEYRLDDLQANENLSYTEFTEVKRALNSVGYAVGSTKEDLADALLRFQEAHRLHMTGLLDAPTKDVIAKLVREADKRISAP